MQGVREPVDVRLLDRLAEVRVDEQLDLVIDEPRDGPAEVLVAQHLVALGVDRLALLVDDVVVFDDALADVEVVALDAGLGVLDRPRHELRLDRDIALEAHPFHEPGDPVAREALQERVLEREVEARRARVALAAGTTTQLVVDAARVVALGPDDVKPARRHDLVVVDAALLLRLGEGLRDRPPAGASAGLMPRAWSLLEARPVGLPPSRMSVPRPAMFVAIVTEPLRPAWATIGASFSWYFALRTSWRTPRRLSIVESTSLFSTLTVPTRTGRPAS